MFWRVSAAAAAIAVSILGVLMVPPSYAAPPSDLPGPPFTEQIPQSMVQQGFAASPIPKDKLNLKGQNPYLVGLGSYLVNGAADCNGCHTFPRFLDVGVPNGTSYPVVPSADPSAGNPYKDNAPDQSPAQGPLHANTNVAHFLAGGRCFGAVMSRNITPDPQLGNLPSGLTEADFIKMMRTGEDIACEKYGVNPGEPLYAICNLPPSPGMPEKRLQTMSWPTYHNMTDRDLKAIYAYLTTLPHTEACNMPDDGCAGFSGAALHFPSGRYAYNPNGTDPTCPVTQVPLPPAPTAGGGLPPPQ